MISLEPCDELLRPLNKIKPPKQYEEEIGKYEKEAKHWMDKIHSYDLKKSGQFMVG